MTRRIPDDVAARIVALHKAGRDPTAIAKEVGRTNGSVIGLLWRLGLAPPRTPEQLKAMSVDRKTKQDCDTGGRPEPVRRQLPPRKPPRAAYGSALFMNPADMRYGR